MITFDSIREYDHNFLPMAFKDAVSAHRNQVDKAGNPYLAHVLRVAAVVAGDPAAVVVALLHDVSEDTHDTEFERRYWLDRYVSDTYGHDVADTVDALTRRPDEPYDEYISRVCAAGPMARRVKLADVTDNLVHLDELSTMEARRLRRRYEPAVEALVAADLADHPPF